MGTEIITPFTGTLQTQLRVVGATFVKDPPFQGLRDLPDAWKLACLVAPPLVELTSSLASCPLREVWASEPGEILTAFVCGADELVFLALTLTDPSCLCLHYGAEIAPSGSSVLTYPSGSAKTYWRLRALLLAARRQSLPILRCVDAWADLYVAPQDALSHSPRAWTLWLQLVSSFPATQSFANSSVRTVERMSSVAPAVTWTSSGHVTIPKDAARLSPCDLKSRHSTEGFVRQFLHWVVFSLHPTSETEMAGMCLYVHIGSRGFRPIRREIVFPPIPVGTPAPTVAMMVQEVILLALGLVAFPGSKIRMTCTLPMELFETTYFLTWPILSPPTHSTLEDMPKSWLRFAKLLKQLPTAHAFRSR